MIKVTGSTNPTKNARNGLSLTPGNLGGNVTINATTQINAIVKETCPLATSPMTDEISGATRRCIAASLDNDAMIFTRPKTSLALFFSDTWSYVVMHAWVREQRPTSRSAKARDVMRKFETTWSDFLLQITLIVREFPTVPNRNKIFHS